MQTNEYGSVELQQIGQMQNDAKKKITAAKMGIARKKVTQMMRCTASLTFLTARFGQVAVLRNISRCVKTLVLPASGTS